MAVILQWKMGLLRVKFASTGKVRVATGTLNYRSEIAQRSLFTKLQCHTAIFESVVSWFINLNDTYFSSLFQVEAEVVRDVLVTFSRDKRQFLSGHIYGNELKDVL